MRIYCSPALARHLRTCWSLLVLVLLSAALRSPVLHAQDESAVGNQYVTAHVINSNSDYFGGGRFYIDAGPYYSGYRFLYYITSNVVFRTNGPNGVNYYTNSKSVFGGQPLQDDGITEVAYTPFDSISTGTDTIQVFWKNIGGYEVVMRLFAEKPVTQFDRGSDIIIEFSYSPRPFAPASDLGIFMMLDTYNGQAEGGGGGGDQSSVLTDHGYYPTDQPGRLFTPPYDTIPTFYHVGNFLTQPPINTVLPVHRLQGKSHGGLDLTTPDVFAIGNWRKFRYLSWTIGSQDIGGVNVGDCATALRWGGLRGSGTLRTAFGMNDKEGNNLFHCRDKQVFVDIQSSARVIEQKVKNGAYLPSQVDVKVWLTNTADVQETVTLTLERPIGGNDPTLSGRLLLDPSTSDVQVAVLPIRGTRMLLYRLDLAQNVSDSLVDIPLDFRFQVTGTPGSPRVFKLPCTPSIAIKGIREPPPPVDTIAPQILHMSNTRVPKPTWTFQTFDRHPNYTIDTGLDRIVVERDDNANVSFTYAPVNFNRCDTSETVNITATVQDSTQSAYLVFAVYDCRNNVRRDSVVYNPRPDIFKPTLLKLDTYGATGPSCNSRTLEYTFLDSLNQTPTAGDVGFGSITVLGPLDNFRTLEVNFDRGNVPIKVFDPRVSFRLSVIDSMVDANATVLVSDYAGNADTVQVHYCTLPDTAAPRASVVPTPNPDPVQGPVEWFITATDTLAWDRGLESVVVLSNTNMLFKPPALTPGQGVATFGASVIKDSMDAEITIEIRDRYYAAFPAGHADTIQLLYKKVPDTLAPNIVYNPVAGSNGAVVDVDVNDIHYPGGNLYKYDRGLANVNVTSITPNLKLVSVPTFNPGDMQTGFRFQVIDTLSLSKYDTLCVEAVDLYGNRSSACYIYPLHADTLSPVLLLTLDAAHTAFTGTATDNRTYDRGLGSITVENPVNLEPADITQTGLNGRQSMPVSVRVTDPAKPISGTFFVRDFVAELEKTSETDALHAVRIPFSVPAVALALKMPLMVERNGDIHVLLIAASDFPGADVSKLTFIATFSGDASFTKSVDSSAALQVVPAAGSLAITCTPANRAYSAGDVLGELVFASIGGNDVRQLFMSVDPATLHVNDDLPHDIIVTKPGDAVSSILRLSPPLARITADSVTYINGVCDRILGGRVTGNGKVNGLAILNLLPQPHSMGSGTTLSVDLRDVPRDGASAELVSATGVVVARLSIAGSDMRVVRVPIALPADLASGVYMLRVHASSGMDQAKVLVVQ